MLNLSKKIEGLEGADYNPRKIGEEDLRVLKESVTKLGIVKPVIVRGNTIVAGHQRIKALRACGILFAPVYELGTDTTTYDEVRFNQLHNGTDMDSGDEGCTIIGGFISTGYNFVDHENINGNMRGKMAVVRGEIAKLIIKFGSWGGVVCTKSGKVIHCAQYALAAKLTKTKLTAYVIEDDQEQLYTSYLNKEYGVFSYDNLKKDTFIQTFAQIFRLRNDDGQGRNSMLYEQNVMPYIENNKNLRIIDFGAGQGDYAKMLKKQGYNIIDVELFRRSAATHVIDVKAVVRMINRMCAEIKKHGLFDIVICDSVLNSIDSLEAETHVMNFLNMLCNDNGVIFFSGRSKGFIQGHLNSTQAKGKERYIEFMDDKGFTALFRKGRWFYQKYHDLALIEGIIKNANMQAVKITYSKSNSSWQVIAKKRSNIDKTAAIQSIKFEFNLNISDNRKLGKEKDVLRAFNLSEDYL